MAAVSTALAVGAGALSLGKGIHDMSQGAKIERDATKAIENYSRQSLRNVMSGMTVPTRGATLATQETQRTQAETSYMASQAGARGAVGASMGIADATRESINRIGAQLDEAEFRMQSMIAQDEANIRGLREQREEADLMALGQQRAYGQGLRQSAFDTGISTIASMAELSSDTEWGKKKLW